MTAIDKKQMRVRDSCGRLDSPAHVREVRAAICGRVLSAALAALLALTLFPVRLLADGVNANIISGPTFVPVVDMYGASVAAPDRYTAAALLMGYGPDAVASWSADVKAKLSNASTGGDFYTFATLSVQNYYDVTDRDGVFWAFVQFVGGVFWEMAQTLYGNNLWASMYTDAELQSARAALENVLNGGGGGGGGPSTEFPNTLVLTNYVGDVQQITIQFADFAVEQANRLLVDYPYYQVSVCQRYSTIWLGVLFSNQPFETRASVEGTEGGKTLYRISSVFNVASTYRYGSVQNNFTKNGNVWSGNVSALPSLSTVNAAAGTETVRTGEYPKDGGYYNSSSSSNPVVPPSNWPDEPAAPSPPELPEPSDPTVNPPEPYDPYDPVVDPPAPYNPTGGDTYIYNITNVTEPTDTSSILEWVKKIFYELKALHSDLSTWVQNLGSALDKLRVTLNNGFTQLYGAIDDVESDIQDVVSAVDNANRQIYNRIGQLGTDLKSEFSSLKQYLRQLFNWLGEKMNFNNEGYDDTSVIYWLKRIWGKLGSGDVNVRPTDPTVNPPAWWEWLNRMLDSLLDGLVGVFNNLLGGTGDLLEEVIHQFPFSIPWDIAAFLTVLAAPPVTPVFDIVIPAIDTWWPEYTIHIDMAPFDTAAATIRLMTKVVFAGCLAWKSRELLDMMDVTKW